MLPLIIIAAAAAILTSCTAEDPNAHRWGRGRKFPPSEPEHDSQKSSYRAESESEKLMKKVRPNKKKASRGPKEKGKTRAKRKPIGVGSPASIKCVEDGHKNIIRTNANGGQYGVCKNAAGKECEEWAYFKGECSLD